MATANINKNFLSPLGFRFSIKKTPNINYFVQSVNVPSVALGQVSVPTPFSRIPLAGDHVEYGDLTISFKVDEEMKNYMEIYNWIQAIGFPDNFSQYNDITRAQMGDGVYSDLTLTILTSAMNPKHIITYVDAYPISLTDLEFDSRMPDVEYIEATATFRCRKFNIETL